MPRGVRKARTEEEIPAVSEKLTKTELLSAYEELSQRVQDAQATQTSTADVRAKAEETRRQEAVVESGAQSTIDKIVRDMGELKLRMASSLDQLTSDLMGARGRFEDMHEAVEIQTRKLEELYDIRVAADTLAMTVRELEDKKATYEREHSEALDNFRRTSTDERARFELEMAQTRDQWRREQETHAASLKERDANVKRERGREEEEFSYALKRAREKDADAYREMQETQQRELAAIKERQEKSLSERERLVGEREAELQKLREEVASFPARLEEATRKAASDATARAEEKAALAATLAANEAQTAETLSRMRVETLEKTLAEREARINELRKQLEQAVSKVNDIAVKAIEGASGTHALKAVNEIALEQARHTQQK